ncbi:hypothetical protein GCM10010499_09490 [Streptomyces thermoviolaceus subsp. apingens]|nr:hypothetical protein GCM10010499_09490 [Streptomyces thermoviolaceus subsp. apingens]
MSRLSLGEGEAAVGEAGEASVGDGEVAWACAGSAEGDAVVESPVSFPPQPVSSPPAAATAHNAPRARETDGRLRHLTDWCLLVIMRIQ